MEHLSYKKKYIMNHQSIAMDFLTIKISNFKLHSFEENSICDSSVPDWVLSTSNFHNNKNLLF